MDDRVGPIRQMLADGLTMTEVGRRLGINRATVRGIIQRADNPRPAREAGSPARAFTPAERREAVRRVAAGEGTYAVAESLGIPRKTLMGWIDQAPEGF